MASSYYFVTIAILGLASIVLVHASDPSPLQDFCVAANDSMSAGPKACESRGFLLCRASYATKRIEPGCSTVTPATNGLNTKPEPTHTHALVVRVRSLVVLEGSLYVGFVTSNPDNRLFTKVLYPGEAFVFPEGLIHFQFNTGKTNAVAIAALSSQNPGVITIANAVFGSNPKISTDVLTKAFQVDKNVVDYLQAQFWYPNN
ncbi:RmlC-like cupins superfamily protein [Actinidia rufa]|uniref:Germin-like protein n=1 Tax=Actinidia rufa TaxID=165716 RepID=A0A7J0EPH0_9ERIC|nr:RmlC-like cupins superfamily protein [Actinidia rufa]